MFTKIHLKTTTTYWHRRQWNWKC